VVRKQRASRLHAGTQFAKPARSGALVRLPRVVRETARDVLTNRGFHIAPGAISEVPNQRG